MKRAALPLLLLAGLLSSCEDREARAENARLAARVTALETQVRALKARQGSLATVQQAAGQNCANELARVLESLRQDDGQYPPMRLVTLPDACIDLRVNWHMLKPQAYAFDVTDAAGQVLTTQRGP